MTGLVAWFWANVWPNLVASAICAGVVWWRARVHIHATHAIREAAHQARHTELLAHLTSLPHPDDASGGTS